MYDRGTSALCRCSVMCRGGIFCGCNIDLYFLSIHACEHSIHHDIFSEAVKFWCRLLSDWCSLYCSFSSSYRKEYMDWGYKCMLCTWSGLLPLIILSKRSRINIEGISIVNTYICSVIRLLTSPFIVSPRWHRNQATRRKVSWIWIIAFCFSKTIYQFLETHRKLV